MKYIHLIKDFGTGGGERVVAEITKSLNGRVRHHIYTYGHYNCLFAHEIISSGVELRHFDGIISLFSCLYLEKRSGAQLRIFSYMTRANVAAYIFNKTLNIEYVASIHLFPHAFERESMFKSLFRGSIYKLFIGSSRKTICVSFGVYTGVSDLVGSTKNLVHIPNPIIGSDFHIRANKHVDIDCSFLNTKKIVACGRIEYQKGFDLLLDAFAIVEKSYPNCSLILVGGGSLADSILKKSKMLGLSQKIQVTGYIENPLPYMVLADVFVLSSRYEGFGNVLAEALALGCRCVAFNCLSGPAEILNQGQFGTLVESGNVQMLADSIMSMMSLAINPYSEGLLSNHLAQFRSEFVSERYIRIWES